MADLDQLVVKVTADTGEFQGKMRDAASGLDQFGAKAAAAGKAAGTLNDANNQSVSALDKLLARYDPQTKGLQNLSLVHAQVAKAQAAGTQVTQQQSEAIDRITARFAPASLASRAFGEAVSGVKGQLIALAAGAGPVGVFLAGLGPWGLAAAAGIGLVTAGFSKMSAMADELASKALRIREFAATTSFTTDQVQALTDAAAKHGVAVDSAVSSIQRFTASWEEMRKGGGAMLEEINKIDSGLAQQMKMAGNVAAAWDLFSAAVMRADTSQRNLLLRAAGGRTGIQNLSGMVADTNAAGGTNNLVTELKTTGGVMQKELIDRLATYRTDIDSTGERIQTKIASVFGGTVLENQKNARKEVEGILDAILNFQAPQWWTQFWSWANRPIGSSAPSRPASMPYQSPAADQALRNAPAPIPPQPLTPEAVLAQSRAQVSILGEAATQTELLKNRQLELADSAKKAGVGADFVKRGYDAYSLSLSQANEATKQSLGVASEAEIATARMVDLREKERRGLELTTAQRETAIGIIQKESRAQAEANQVRASATPGLTQIALDAGNPFKQLDTAAVSSLNGMNSALLDFQMGVTTGKDAMKAFETQFVRSLFNMANQMLIMQPIAKALQAAINGLGGYFAPAAAGQPIAAAAAGYPTGFVGPIPPTTGRSGGMVGSLPSYGSYVHPAYFENAPRFASGGRITDDGVPIIAHPGERILNRQETQAYNRGSGPLEVSINIDLAGANGDETIRRIAYQAANQGMQAALAKVPGVAVSAVASKRTNTPGYLRS